MHKPAFFPMLSGSALVAALLFATAGCGSGPVPRDLMMEEANAGTSASDRPVAMRGETTFLDGKLSALATVSRGFDRGAKSGPGPNQGKGRGRRNNSAYENDMSDIFGSGESEEAQKEAMEAYIRMAKAQRAAGSPMPPVTLRVALENRGTEPIEIAVTDVKSDLGNFAVRPPKLTLAPGESGTLDPMVSQLGVMSDEIPLTLVIQSGGKRETQVVTVKNIILPSVRK